MANAWHLITCEYPPRIGGVADYTRGVAVALACEGDSVHVWCPSMAPDTSVNEGITLHSVFGRFRPTDLCRAGRELDEFEGSRRLVVQWVPHGYGYKSLNLPFCLWLWKRARWNRDRVYVMVHEPYLPFKRRHWRQNFAAVIHRLMTAVLMNAAHHVWVSVPAWERRLKAYSAGRRVPISWLPVISNIAMSDQIEPSIVRELYANDKEILIGHFGTFNRETADLIAPIVLALRRRVNYQFLFIGKGSREFLNHLQVADSNFGSRLHATGAVSETEVSNHIAACDLLIQPYADGASSRRGSLMAAIAHGKPVVTNEGPHSEEVWKKSNAVLLAPYRDVKKFVGLTEQLAGDVCLRARLKQAAIRLYDEHFDIRHVITGIRKVALAA